MSLIVNLFNEFVQNGGEPKVSEFKLYLDRQINDEVKPLCIRSLRAREVESLKDRFKGRGSKWYFVSLEEIKPTLDSLRERGIDVTDYEKFISDKGMAWIRYAKTDVNKRSVAFQVRTMGSTVDRPKQLHYISFDELDDKIVKMSDTPLKLHLETIDNVALNISDDDYQTEVCNKDSLNTSNFYVQNSQSLSVLAFELAAKLIL